jgi:dipeptidyl aminopeptidase/acylaminoacyl peptidase
VRLDGAVLGAPFDAEALELVGPAVPLLDGVSSGSAHPDMALAPDGTLLMMAGEAGGIVRNRQVVWVSREGLVRPVDPLWTAFMGWNLSVALSPDGSRLAYGQRTEEGDDVFIRHLEQGTESRLTFHQAQESRPRWSPDGERVYFVRYWQGEADLYGGRADGAEPVYPVLVGEGKPFQHDWSRDGEWLVTREGGTIGMEGGRDIVAYHLVGDTARIPILDSPYDEVSPRLSPNGRWLAYVSEETGDEDWELYVRPFPEVNAGRWMVSGGGGYMPLWAHSGRELFFVSTDRRLMVVDVETEGEEFEMGEPRPLFEIPEDFRVGPRHVAFDISPDDREFIMVRALDFSEMESSPVILVMNWVEELKERIREHGG